MLHQKKLVKQKRQAKRKTKQTARLKKQGERTDAKIMKNNPEYTSGSLSYYIKILFKTLTYKTWQ